MAVHATSPVYDSSPQQCGFAMCCMQDRLMESCLAACSHLTTVMYHDLLVADVVLTRPITLQIALLHICQYRQASCFPAVKTAPVVALPTASQLPIPFCCLAVNIQLDASLLLLYRVQQGLESSASIMYIRWSQVCCCFSGAIIMKLAANAVIRHCKVAAALPFSWGSAAMHL